MDQAVAYRKAAAASLKMAQLCTDFDQKGRWLRVRDRWTTLAIEIENEAAGFAALKDFNTDAETPNIDTSMLKRLLNDMRSAIPQSGG